MERVKSVVTAEKKRPIYDETDERRACCRTPKRRFHADRIEDAVRGKSP